MEGQDFTDADQVLQCTVIHENHARDNRSYSRFKDVSRDKDKSVVHFVDEESAEGGDAEICVAEWVHSPKPISCSFLKPNEAKKDEMRNMFDVSKCDRLFDVIIQGG
jgi:hypothetical protein